MIFRVPTRLATGPRGLDSANLLYLSQVSCCELLLLHEGVDFAVECMEGASEGVLA